MHAQENWLQGSSWAGHPCLRPLRDSWTDRSPAPEIPPAWPPPSSPGGDSIKRHYCHAHPDFRIVYASSRLFISLLLLFCFLSRSRLLLAPVLHHLVWINNSVSNWPSQLQQPPLHPLPSPSLPPTCASNSPKATHIHKTLPRGFTDCPNSTEL